MYFHVFANGSIISVCIFVKGPAYDTTCTRICSCCLPQMLVMNKVNVSFQLIVYLLLDRVRCPVTTYVCIDCKYTYLCMCLNTIRKCITLSPQTELLRQIFTKFTCQIQLRSSPNLHDNLQDVPGTLGASSAFHL